jgi:sulfur-oxidizing protein SoxY
MTIPMRREASPFRSALAAGPAPASTRRDPLDSPLWDGHAKRYLGGGDVVFDDRVQVILPPVTENQARVPVVVDARALGPVDEIAVIADNHPFPLTLRLEPVVARAFVAFRMKIEQATPIRAAVRQGALWHVGGRYLDAQGGGCSVPPVVEKTVDWRRIGETRARIWREPEGHLRLRVRLLHPMDNGMIANIPMFIVETLDVTDASGAPLAKLQLSEAIADDPTLTLLPDLPADGSTLKISARDNNGGLFHTAIPIPAAGLPDRTEVRP